jgi:hypothetical protein
MTMVDVHAHNVNLVGLLDRQPAAFFGLDVAKVTEIALHCG